nr:hypothetical protein [Angustibacter aerolatus]
MTDVPQPAAARRRALPAAGPPQRRGGRRRRRAARACACASAPCWPPGCRSRWPTPAPRTRRWSG